jgi:hypothetical protein
MFDGEIQGPEIPKASTIDIIEILKSKITQLITEPTDTGDVVQILKEIKLQLETTFRGSTLLDSDRVKFLYSGNCEDDNNYTIIVPAKADHRIVLTRLMIFQYDTVNNSDRPSLPFQFTLTDNQTPSTPYYEVMLRAIPGEQLLINFDTPFYGNLGLPLYMKGLDVATTFGALWGGASSYGRYVAIGYWERN